MFRQLDDTYTRFIVDTSNRTKTFIVIRSSTPQNVCVNDVSLTGTDNKIDLDTLKMNA